MNIGEKIKKIREESGFTQKNISNFLGIDQSMISKIESGERNLSSDTLSRLASLFGVNISDILSENDIQVRTKCAFRTNNLTADDLQTISFINKIALNANFMTEILGE